MKVIPFLLLFILAVSANVCTNEYQEAGSAISGSFTIPGYSKHYSFDILDDQNNDLLYFVGQLRPSSSPWLTIIYKANYELSKIQVMTYDIDPYECSYPISLNKNFIYIQGRNSNKIYEIQTVDLAISRQMSISSSATADARSLIKMKENLYFSFIMSSVMQTCRWDTVGTNLDCFTFGVSRHTNFAPINEDLLFSASVDTTGDQYYLVNYNFSDSSNLVWKRSIACPTSGCFNKISSSIISRDQKWIYTMILYDGHYIFHKLSVVDGSPQNSGFIWNDSGLFDSYSMKEFEDFIAVQIKTSSLALYKRLILISTSNSEIVAEYKSGTARAFAVGRLLNKGQELMYHSGIYPSGFKFYFARTSIKSIDQLEEFEQDSPLFSPSTGDYQVSPTSSNPSLTSSTKTVTISTSTSVTLTDITSTTNPSFTTHVALWNQDHIQSVQGNTSVQLDFTWACAQSVNNTDIAFSLVQTGSNTVPEWVSMNPDKQELHLNTTPKLDQDTTYYFSLEIAFNSKIYHKKFEITVEKCSILNCEICQLGASNLCETCTTDYEATDGQKSCNKIIPVSGATEDSASMVSSNVVTGMVTSSVVLASVSSILSLSSVNSIFSIMNSLQLAILLPLVPDYFSPKVLDLLSGMGFAMFSFDFIKFKDIPFVEAISDWVSYPQSDEYLNNLGLRSGSSFVNYLSLMAVIVLVGIIHVGISVCNQCGENSKPRKCKKFINTLFTFFTFNIYIRVFIQAFLFTSLSILSELYNFNLDTTVTKVSLGVCVLFCLCTSVLFILSFYMYYKSFPEIDKKKYWPCIEYFNGIKPNNLSKMYSSMFMLVRLMLSSFLILGAAISGSTKGTYFYLVNIGYCLYLAGIRPFENMQDNIIEIINQIIFCCLSVPLSWLNTKESWTPFYENYYTKMLLVAPVIGSIVCLGFLIKSIISYIYRRKAKKRKQDVAPKKTDRRKRRPKNGEEPGRKVTHSIVDPSFSMNQNNVSMVPICRHRRKVTQIKKIRNKLRLNL
ncbi:unnamed protein product [Moneuplotes crassus]|uniref:Transmembrane protein n=1 Tax=Euplotes crassus TaxID=5936 RepID=A0AAD2D5V3_EUPCR|nr:unnamed protein product [Moneuplotes crassus]